MSDSTNEKITNEEILELMINKGLTIEKVIDAIVDHNHIIGVGLITLAETFYLYTFYNTELRKHTITKEEIQELLDKGRRVKFN